MIVDCKKKIEIVEFDAPLHCGPRI